MSNKQRKTEDVYSERHIRRIIRQQTFNDFNEIRSQIFSQDNLAESSTNADTHCDCAHPKCDDSPNFSLQTDNVNHNDLDILKVVYTSDIEQFNNNEFESDAESQDNDDNNECVIEEIENEQIEMNLECSSEQRQEKLQQKLCLWAEQFKVPLNAISSLLCILNELPGVTLPMDARTLLRTPRSTDVVVMRNGHYYHFGFTNVVQKIIKQRLKMQHVFDTLYLKINIDGAPAGESTSKSLWPILCADSTVNIIHPIGIYYGLGKPESCNEYLQRFVKEAVTLINNGFYYNNEIYFIRIVAFVCDSPAKSYILNVKYHSGYNSCTKCKIEGECINGTVCFPGSISHLRTDDEFKLLAYIDDYQRGETILNELPSVGLVSNVVLDPMHLVYLGVVRTLIRLWLSGPLGIRLSANEIDLISNRLLNLRRYKPIEFVRYPRCLKEWRKWKATEFRQFLLYWGPLVLKNILRNDLYDNFLTLHVAVTILANPSLIKESNNVIYAGGLLQHFVQCFETTYGKRYVTFNIHNLLHLSADVQKFGALENFSAFVFENYLKSLKRLLRKGQKPLEQIARRIYESDNISHQYIQNDFNKCNKIRYTDDVCLQQAHNTGPVNYDRTYEFQYKIFQTDNLVINSTDDRNNCVQFMNGIIVEIYNFAISKNKLYIIGKQLKEENKQLYTKPCSSTSINIKIVTNCSNNKLLETWIYEGIFCKMYKMSYNNHIILFPIIHTQNI